MVESNADAFKTRIMNAKLKDTPEAHHWSNLAQMNTRIRALENHVKELRAQNAAQEQLLMFLTKDRDQMRTEFGILRNNISLVDAKAQVANRRVEILEGDTRKLVDRSAGKGGDAKVSQHWVEFGKEADGSKGGEGGFVMTGTNGERIYPEDWKEKVAEATDKFVKVASTSEHSVVDEVAPLVKKGIISATPEQKAVRKVLDAAGDHATNLGVHIMLNQEALKKLSEARHNPAFTPLAGDEDLAGITADVSKYLGHSIIEVDHPPARNLAGRRLDTPTRTLQEAEQVKGSAFDREFGGEEDTGKLYVDNIEDGIKNGQL